MPLSIILSIGWLALGFLSGVFALFRVELLSVEGVFAIGVLGVSLYTIYALFYERNIGRLLAAAQLILSGLVVTVICIFLSMAGGPITLLIVDILIATFQLTLAWHLFVSEVVKEYVHGHARQST